MVRSLGEAPGDLIYLPFTQSDVPLASFVAKTTGSPDEMVRSLVAAGREIDPGMWVWEAKTMARHLAVSRLPAQAAAFVLSVFGVLALGLAVIGLYGVVRFAVATRTREVGIRMALGADAATVVRSLASSGMRLVALGCGLGLALSLLVTRPLGGLLFGVETSDPVTFIAAPLLLGVTALIAAYLPARRASRVNPVVALRSD